MSSIPPLSQSTTPLSSEEREELRRTRGSRLPLVFVVISLAISIALPRFSVRRITRLRNEVTSVVDPARLHLTEIQLDLALEGTQRRGFLLTADTGVARELAGTRAHRLRAEQQLLASARQLDGLGTFAFTGLVTKLEALDRSLDSVVTTGRATTGDDLRKQHGLWVAVRAAADTLRSAVDGVARSRRAAIDRTVSDVERVTAGLLLLGIGAAFLVGRLGSRFRALALRLDENEARFRQITENLSAVVWLSDPDFRRTLYVNRAYERIWGGARATLETDPDAFMKGVHPDDRDKLRSALAEIEHRVADVEFRVVRSNGEMRWVWNRAFPVRDSSGRIFRIAGIIEDITERRQDALERERLLESERAARTVAEQRQLELERVTESRERLVRGFTHDVKNPLGAADGYLTLLEEGAFGRVEDGQRTAVTKVRRSIREALELIGHVLEIARAEAGELEIHKEATDLDELVRELVDAFTAQARAKEIALVAEQWSRLPTIFTDSTRVRQVVQNLLSNALKYTPRGGRIAVDVGTMSESPEPEDEQIIITVSDNGPGIPLDKLPMLFLEFTRFHPGGADGAGIGLAISQKIAQALGGEITVHSTPGAGATFAFHLPCSERTVETNRVSQPGALLTELSPSRL
jgi:PAS domain S-box-containing protein